MKRFIPTAIVHNYEELRQNTTINKKSKAIRAVGLGVAIGVVGPTAVAGAYLANRAVNLVCNKTFNRKD